MQVLSLPPQTSPMADKEECQLEITLTDQLLFNDVHFKAIKELLQENSGATVINTKIIVSSNTLNINTNKPEDYVGDKTQLEHTMYTVINVTTEIDRSIENLDI